MNALAARRENRAEVRQLYSALPSQVRALAGTGVLAVDIHDISRNGIGLLSREPIVTNKPIMVEVYNHAKSCWQFHAAWAIHCTERAEGDWLVGCSFLRSFTEQELQAVLGAVAA